MIAKERLDVVPPKNFMADAVKYLAHLRPDPRNARKHSERNVAMIVDALQDVGAARSIVIDEDDVVLCGNATLTAAAEAGIQNVVVVDATGDELIAVRRRNLSPEQKTRLALFDNRAGELASWNDDELQRLASEGFDLSAVFTDEELAAAIGGLEKQIGRAADAIDDGSSDAYKQQYGVIVMCASEAEQEAIYERLTADGLTCRVVVT